MAMARMKDGKVVDLGEAQILPSEHEVFAVLVCAGDTNENGKADVTIAPGARLPLLPPMSMPAQTHDVPVEQVLAALTAVIGGAAASPRASEVLRLVRKVLGR